MVERYDKGITSGKVVKWTTRILVLAALMVSLSACVWNLDEETQLGSLTVSISGGDGVGALDFAGFSTVSFVVMEADQFRLANLNNVEFPVRPLGYGEGPRQDFILDFDPTPLVDVAFQPFELDDAGDYPEQGVSAVFPRGRAVSYGPNQWDGIPEPVSFDNLVVGKEYVVWIDGQAEEPLFQSLFGFAFVRIRSGAPTTVSIDLSADRFESFVELIYARYIEPRVPRFNLGQFSAILYSGTGGATIAYTDEDGDFSGTEVQEYENAVVFRIAYPEFGFTVFFVAFFPEDAGEEDFADLSFVLIENAGVLEPARSTYTAPTSLFTVDPGNVVAVEGWLSSEFADFSLDFADPSAPIEITQMGFIGGSPSNGGTFAAEVSGIDEWTGYSYTVSNMSFTFGAVIGVFDEFDFDFDVPDDFEFQIGEIGPAGGYIIYVDEEGEFGWRYMEAAPFDVGGTGVFWDSRPEPPVIGGTSEALGSGRDNTSLIVQDLDDAELSGLAAQLANELEITVGETVFDDWFLPSREEMILMSAVFDVVGLDSAFYWTSSEIEATSAVRGVAIDPGDGTVFEDPLAKGWSQRVRPVRTFGVNVQQ